MTPPTKRASFTRRDTGALLLPWDRKRSGAMIALQLNPPLFVVTPKGDGIARVIFDYGPDINPMFLVELNESRDLLCFDMLDVKGSGNSAWGLSHAEPFESRA